MKVSRRATSERGFTLLELVVVCALIGIMLSVSIPSLRMTFSDPLKSVVRKLIGLTEGVRELAVRTQQPYLLHINASEKRIWYEKDKTQEADEVVEEVEEKRRKKDLILPESVKISGIWIDDKESSEDSAIWISRQGYMQRTRIGIEDEDGNNLVVQFFPFLDAATVTNSP